MINISSNASNQLYEIILLLPDDRREKIPSNIINLLKERKAEKEELKIKNINDINNENISEETKKYLAYIFLNYLADEAEKIEFSKILKENDKRHQDNLRKKYDPSDIFNNRNKSKRMRSNIQYKNSTEDNNKLVVIETKNWWNRILDKIISLFKK
ncbi:MAG: hypothetical protein HFJ17_04070 [Clostridia bacterium]|nr:hypothetical protein [Clostridia bacterium]